MKYRNGDVITLFWECDPTSFYVKGHVPPEEAMQALMRIDDQMCYEDSLHYELATPITAYARWSREWNPIDGEAGCVLREYAEPGRGRFPVMVARVIRPRTPEEVDQLIAAAELGQSSNT